MNLSVARAVNRKADNGACLLRFSRQRIDLRRITGEELYFSLPWSVRQAALAVGK